MALIDCPECKRKMSDKATFCVGCGAPFNGLQIKIIGTPIRIGKLEIAQFDFPDAMDWHKANYTCESLGEGWRLPTKDEMNILYQNKEKIGGFFSNNYWSSTMYGFNNAWLQRFWYYQQDYTAKSDKLKVRAVRYF